MRRAPRARIRLACGVFGMLLTSCVSGSYERFSDGEPIEQASIDSLVPGEADLGDCLRVLGAPNLVATYDPEDAVLRATDGQVSMAWLWVDRSGFSVRVSIPLLGRVDSNQEVFRYANSAADYLATVAIFDADLELVSIRRGYAGDFEDIDFTAAFRRST